MRKIEVKLSRPSPMDVVRKSELIDFGYCPHKFKLRKKGIEGSKPPQLVRGIQFHKAAHDLFDRVEREEMESFETQDEVLEYLRKVSNFGLEDPVSGWFDDFLEHEAARWFEVDYWMPVYREKYVEHSGRVMGLQLTGHIDRVDLIGPNKVSIVEYKPKATDKLSVELAFYTAVFNHQIRETMEATKCECYQYLKGTRVEIRPSFRQLTRRLQKIKECIEEEKFEKNYYICNWCYLRDQCLTQEEIEKLLEEGKLDA